MSKFKFAAISRLTKKDGQYTPSIVNSTLAQRKFKIWLKAENLFKLITSQANRHEFKIFYHEKTVKTKYTWCHSQGEILEPKSNIQSVKIGKQHIYMCRSELEHIQELTIADPLIRHLKMLSR